MSRGCCRIGFAALASGLSLWLASIVVAQQPIVPIQPPFSQAIAQKTAAGLQLQQLVTELVTQAVDETYTVVTKVPTTRIDPLTQKAVTREEEVTEARTRRVTRVTPVTKQVASVYAWPRMSASEVSGKPLPAGDLQERLATRTLVLVVSGGVRFPQEFAPLFKPDTIVLDLHGAQPEPNAALTDTEALPLPLPQFQELTINRHGQYSFRTSQLREFVSMRPCMKTERRIIDGKPVEVSVCVPIQVTEQQQISHSIQYPEEAVQAATLDKTPLTDRHRDALKQREIPVVVTQQGQPVDPLWLSNIRPSMLQLTVPGFGGPGPATDPAPPPADPLPGVPAAPVPAVPAPALPAALPAALPPAAPIPAALPVPKPAIPAAP